jgi:hypothetical protein
MKFESHIPELEQALQRASETGMMAMATYLVPELQQVLSVVNPGKSVKYKRPSKSGAKSHTVYGKPSAPGEPPRQRTGTGKGMVSFEVKTEGDTVTLRVGVPESAVYLGYHEAGINYGRTGEQRRPWLAITVEKHVAALAQLFASGARQ